MRGRRPLPGPMVPTVVERAVNIVEDWRALGGREGPDEALAVVWRDRWEVIIRVR